MAQLDQSPDLVSLEGASAAAGDCASAQGDGSGRFSLQSLGRFATGQVAAWNQRRFAGKGAQLAIELYQRLRAEQPGLQAENLYAAFVCRRNGVDDPAARLVLKRAAESFAAWPNERPLIFQDVVKYLIISEFLATGDERAGTTIDMARVIGQIVPKAW